MDVIQEEFNEYYAEYISSLNNVFNQTENLNSFNILHPDSALLRRFQSAFKTVLEKQLCYLNENILKLEADMKRVKSEKSYLAEVTFNDEEEIKKQEISLDQYRDSITEAINMRKQESDCITERKNKLQSGNFQNELLESENRELEERQQFLNLVIYKLSAYNDAKESKLVTSKLSVEKSIQNKQEFLNDKQIQDIILMKLEKDVMKLDAEEQLLRNSLLVEEAASVDHLKSVISLNTRKVEEISENNVQLFNHWQNVIGAVRKRDEAYYKFVNELMHFESHHRQLQIEIQNVKKKLEEAIVKGEILTTQKNKQEKNSYLLRKEIVELQARFRSTNIMISNLSIVINSTEKTFTRITTVDKLNYTSELSVIDNVVKKLHNENSKLEETMLQQLQENIKSASDVSRINLNVKLVKNKLQHTEHALASYENEYCSLLQEMKIADNEFENTLQRLNLMKAKYLAKKVELDGISSELASAKDLIGKKSISLATKITCFNELQKKQTPIEEELKERTISATKNINELIESSKELKRGWIRKENDYAHLMRMKDEKISELEAVKKKIFAMQYKKTVLNQFISERETEYVATNKQISLLLNLVSKLNSNYVEVRKEKEVLNDENIIMYNQRVVSLKEMEDDVLSLVRNMADLESEKDEICKKLLNLQYEDLSWDATVKMASNMRLEILKEKSSDGDIGNMKVEIHHMKVRYSQLKKVQDKLACDLEMSVLKRDSIINEVLVVEKKDRSQYFETMYSRKINFLTDKINRIKQEIRKVEEKLSILGKNIYRLKIDINNSTNEQELLQQSLSMLLDETGDINRHKHLNSELRTYKQRKLCYLLQAKSGNYVALYKSYDSVETEYLKQSCLNSDLISILESLNNDFPLYNETLSKMLYFLNFVSL